MVGFCVSVFNQGIVCLLLAKQLDSEGCQGTLRFCTSAIGALISLLALPKLVETGQWFLAESYKAFDHLKMRNINIRYRTKASSCLYWSLS